MYSICIHVPGSGSSSADKRLKMASVVTQNCMPATTGWVSGHLHRPAAADSTADRNRKSVTNV
jgi:hypothetical protein